MSCSWLQFDDEFVAKHYPQFESAEDLRSSLLSSTSLARMQDVNAQVQDAIVTQARLLGGGEEVLTSRFFHRKAVLSIIASPSACTFEALKPWVSSCQGSS
jgi:hypothetical protein